MPEQETWVLVADGARARLLRADVRARRLETLREEESAAARAKTSDLMSDRPGSAFESRSLGKRSAMEPPTDPKQLEKQRFARHLAALLEEAESKGRFERLVVVAAPQTLGDLRAELPPAVLSRVDAEIDKDLTWVEPAELGRHLAPILWPLAA
jgi:protein required for attachment to host cells